MRSTVLPSLALVLLLVPGGALAATLATYGNTNTHCYTYGPAEGFTQPVTGFVDVPGHECSLSDKGRVAILGCTASECSVAASGTFTGAWNVPAYGYVNAVVARDFFNGSAICGYSPGDPLRGSLPTTGGACSGVAAPLPVPVKAGQCAPVYVFATVQLYVVSVNGPGIGYMPLTYTWSRIDHQFSLCRDAGTGNPRIDHVADLLY